MNLLRKTTPWLAGLLTAASAVFGIDDKPSRPNKCDTGKTVVRPQMMPGYNAPARTDVRGSWDISTSGSFIYWQMSQDDMEVAFADGLTNASYTGSSQINGDLVPMDFSYLPGFKVGLGLNFDHDDWDAFAEYTRLHGSNSASTNGQQAAGQAAGVTGPILPTWGHPYLVSSNAYNSASEDWNINLDFIDLDLGRSYYVGTQLIFRPFYGARGGFLTQSAHAHYVNTSLTNAVGTFVEVPGVLDVYKRNRFWAIGPRVGVNTNWMVGQGIRFFGNAVADLLYTKYKIQNKSTFVATAAGAGLTAGQNIFFISRERQTALRTHLDLEMGLGWGSYFDNNNWHIDLSAAYGFQVFFDQNMLGTFWNATMPGRTLNPTGNLYAQGLTATVKFDF